MEVERTNSYFPIRGPEARPARRTAPAATDGGEFAGTEALKRALESTPEIRPEAVERGRALVGSNEFPPEQTLRRLARLFALEFGGQKTPPTES